MKKRTLLVILALLLPALVSAANDPGHDTLYIEENGDSNLTGSLNISNHLEVANRLYSDYLDIIGNGTDNIGSTNRILGTQAALYIESPEDIIFNAYVGTAKQVRLGNDVADTVDLNVTGSVYVKGNQDITIGGTSVCMANGTNCIGGNNTGNVSEVTAGSGLTGGGTGSVTVDVGSGSGITVNANDVAIDPTYTQRRVGSVCGAGEAIQGINNDGTVNCTSTSGASSGAGWTNTSTTTSTGLHVNVSDELLFVNSTDRHISIADPAATGTYRLNINTSQYGGGWMIINESSKMGAWAMDSGSNAGGWIGMDSDQPLRFYTNEVEVGMFLDTDEQLGINNSDPNATLHVQGTAIVSGTLQANGSYVCTVANGLCNQSSSADGTGGWTNTSTQTSTGLHVNVSGSGSIPALYVNNTDEAMVGINAIPTDEGGTLTGTFLWMGIESDQYSTLQFADQENSRRRWGVGANAYNRGSPASPHLDNLFYIYQDTYSSNATAEWYALVIDDESEVGIATTYPNATLHVAGDAIITDSLDMDASIISNIGVAGTDFNTTGGLTLADALTVSSNQISAFTGNITVNSGEVVCTVANGLCNQSFTDTTDGTGGWTNTSTTTSTSLNVNVTNTADETKVYVNTSGNVTSFNGVINPIGNSPKGYEIILGYTESTTSYGDVGTYDKTGGVHKWHWGSLSDTFTEFPELKNAYYVWQWTNKSDDVIDGSGIYRLVIDDYGNVGINNSDPNATLHVDGNAIIAKAITVQGSGTSAFTGNITVNSGEVICTVANGLCNQSATADTWVNESGDTMSGTLDMDANIITNIGNAGTDFSTSGGLQMAGDLNVSGDLNVTGTGPHSFENTLRISNGTTQLLDIDPSPSGRIDINSSGSTDIYIKADGGSVYITLG